MIISLLLLTTTFAVDATRPETTNPSLGASTPSAVAPTPPATPSTTIAAVAVEDPSYKFKPPFEYTLSNVAAALGVDPRTIVNQDDVYTQGTPQPEQWKAVEARGLDATLIAADRDHPSSSVLFFSPSPTNTFGYDKFAIMTVPSFCDSRVLILPVYPFGTQRVPVDADQFYCLQLTWGNRPSPLYTTAGIINTNHVTMLMTFDMFAWWFRETVNFKNERQAGLLLAAPSASCSSVGPSLPLPSDLRGSGTAETSASSASDAVATGNSGGGTDSAAPPTAPSPVTASPAVDTAATAVDVAPPVPAATVADDSTHAGVLAAVATTPASPTEPATASSLSGVGDSDPATPEAISLVAESSDTASSLSSDNADLAAVPAAPSSVTASPAVDTAVAAVDVPPPVPAATVADDSTSPEVPVATIPASPADPATASSLSSGGDSDPTTAPAAPSSVTESPADPATSI